MLFSIMDKYYKYRIKDFVKYDLLKWLAFLLFLTLTIMYGIGLYDEIKDKTESNNGVEKCVGKKDTDTIYHYQSVQFIRCGNGTMPIVINY